MSIKAIDLRKGAGVMWEGAPCLVHSVDHVVKGKGGSVMQVEFRNAKTGQIFPTRLRPNETVEEAYFDRKPMEYLYSEQTCHIVMDPESFEQTELPLDLIGDRKVYLSPNIQLTVHFVEGSAVQVDLPNTVELTVVDVPPEVKGATATAQIKEAVCEGGAQVKVPPFVNNGQVIKVDTRTGEYLGRV